MSNLQNQMGLSDEALASYLRQAKENELEIVRLNAHIETLNNALSGNTESALAELSRENAQLRHSLRLAEMNANFVSSHYGQVIETRRQDIQAAGGIINAIHDGKEKVRKARSRGGEKSRRPGNFKPYIIKYLHEIEEGTHALPKKKPEDDFINWLKEKYKDAVTEKPDGLVELAVEGDRVRSAKKDSISKSIRNAKKRAEADDN
ncbi:hypothetical protein ACFD82_002305 [Escherichia coli]|uniref:hypothetical protein n=2 Tax=Escherichia coli TaxID=562 RepID=UPI00200B88B0|nr:hypothetical protein [Escherichia coli]MED6438404.1 hypothetical protein [Escherichia coli O157]MDI0661985.1 hypothetical protein [Escherichia coli]MDI0716684.1 hypothetical protein [Escherichia coli]MDI0774597.1 hypothetical protein [Escherichia coli]MDI0813294.1 hypothetical protein [Escherichia coli]